MNPRVPSTTLLGRSDELGVMLLLPDQYLRTRIRRDGGARRLMAALLEDAIHCFTKYGHCQTPHGRRLFEEAASWIMDASGPSSVSFVEACDALDIDPDVLRTRLRRWHERAVRFAA